MPNGRHLRSASQSTNPDDNLEEEETRFILNLQQALKDPTIIAGFKGIFDVKKEIGALVGTEIAKHMKPLKDELKAKEKTISDLQERLNKLETKLDDQEQYSRRENLRISGLPEKEGENLEKDLIEVLNTNMELDPPICPDDILRLHRIGKKQPGKHRQIIIRLHSYATRTKIYSQKKKLVRTSLSLNEDLTKTRGHILYLARKAKREGKIAEAWSYNGRLHVKDTAGKIHNDINYVSLAELVGPFQDEALPQRHRP